MRIQAAARGRAARKGVVARRAEAAALSGLQEAGDALGLTGSAEETAAAVRIQAIQRGRMQRQKMKAMQVSVFGFRSITVLARIGTRQSADLERFRR